MKIVKYCDEYDPVQQSYLELVVYKKIFQKCMLTMVYVKSIIIFTYFIKWFNIN